MSIEIISQSIPPSNRLETTIDIVRTYTFGKNLCQFMTKLTFY